MSTETADSSQGARPNARLECVDLDRAQPARGSLIGFASILFADLRMLVTALRSTSTRTARDGRNRRRRRG
jgi:hypothetical protein